MCRLTYEYAVADDRKHIVINAFHDCNPVRHMAELFGSTTGAVVENKGLQIVLQPERNCVNREPASKLLVACKQEGITIECSEDKHQAGRDKHGPLNLSSPLQGESVDVRDADQHLQTICKCHEVDTWIRI